jgi:tRNA(fMet)-specific endonuclease VapC
MKYCLDTNTLIYFFRGQGNVSDRLLTIPPGDIAIPAIVIFELEVGIGKSTSPRKRTAQLHEMVSIVNNIPFGLPEARIAASIRVKLEKSGKPIGLYDILIAASAMANKCTLITHNKNEFSRVPGLKLENWY